MLIRFKDCLYDSVEEIILADDEWINRDYSMSRKTSNWLSHLVLLQRKDNEHHLLFSFNILN